MNDETAIRETIEAWLRASKTGDTGSLASMLDDDMLFVVPGQEPFGKREFLAGNHTPPFRFEAKANILEVVVQGDWALTRIGLGIEITPSENAETVKLAGPTMTVWRRQPDGRWAIWRDANMVAPAPN